MHYSLSVNNILRSISRSISTIGLTSLFKNVKLFSCIYFVLLIADICIKNFFTSIPLRLVTKLSLIILLIVFYVINNRERSKKRVRFMLLALSCFFIGDFFMTLYEIQVFYLIGIVCFIIGKLFYAYRFSNQREFDLITLFPFLAICFAYIIGIMLMVYDTLGAFLVPAFIYLFAALLVAQFAFTRYQEVNLKSFSLVFAGVLFSVCSDSITLLQSFYNPDFFYHKVTIMLFYGVSQYLIVLGILREKNLTIV